MEIAQEEAYIICNSNKFHVVVDGLYMYLIDTLADGYLIFVDSFPRRGLIWNLLVP